MGRRARVVDLPVWLMQAIWWTRGFGGMISSMAKRKGMPRQNASLRPGTQDHAGQSGSATNAEVPVSECGGLRPRSFPRTSSRSAVASATIVRIPCYNSINASVDLFLQISGMSTLPSSASADKMHRPRVDTCPIRHSPFAHSPLMLAAKTYHGPVSISPRGFLIAVAGRTGLKCPPAEDQKPVETVQ